MNSAYAKGALKALMSPPRSKNTPHLASSQKSHTRSLYTLCQTLNSFQFLVMQKTYSIFLLLWPLLFGCSKEHEQQETAPPADDRPNIVLIIADDISWNDFGCYGNPVVQTPNIDKLAANGLVFGNMYLTTSSCSPSRCSIVSGRYPHNTGAAELHTPLPEGIPTFPAKLQAAGYHTAMAGKWHMGEAAKSGFDTLVLKGALNGDGGEESWVDILKARPKGRPFFAWLAAFDAHRTWGPNRFSGTHDAGAVEAPPFLADTDSTKADIARYYDEIYRFDHYIGEVVKELDSQGVLDNTLIMVMADNGRPFPRSKTRLLDSGIKTPFVVHWPKGISQKGKSSPSLVSVIDIAPTVVEMAEASGSESFQGKSFLRLLTGDPAQAFRNYVFAEHNWHDYEALERMVRSQDFLYVLNERPQFPNQGPADSNRSLSFLELLRLRQEGMLSEAQSEIFMAPRPKEEIYDCTNDSLQLYNLAVLPQYAEALQQHRQVMEEWRKQTADNTPEQLTKDQYDRTTGARTSTSESYTEVERGEMPGSANNATSVNAKGPF